MNLLFICKHNRFRSKIAEAYFKKINKNKNIHVKSAGLFKGSPLNHKNNKSVPSARELGIIIKDPTQAISYKLLAWQDAIVIVADDVPEGLFKKIKGKRIIVWNIKDTNSHDKKILKKIIRQIIEKIDSLVEELKEAK
ncbi:MAG: hypothetical protein WCX73_03540 [Candidatus Pacearchaeota archaeon]|jgi:protein-tyrosine-phosphatase